MSRISVWRPAVTSRDDATPAGINVAIDVVAIVAVAFVAAAFPPVDGGWRWAILAAGVGGCAALTIDSPAVVAVVVGLAWLVGNGFLVDRAGELSWHGWADFYRLLVLLAAGAAGLLTARLGRLAREWRDLAQIDAAVRQKVLTMNDEEKQRA